MTKESTFDDYQVNTVYEFTINLRDEYQYPDSPMRLMKCKKILKDIMDLNTWEYHLRVELSQPKFGDYTSCTRVHYHGIVRFKDNDEIRYFLLTQLNKLFKIGRVCINAYRPDHWPTYCRKQKHLFKNSEHCSNIKWAHLILAAFFQD